ncbi:zinc finger protein CONSTANS-LIKE 2-like [Actinidia eriantha]|uniref:zinc finger protein CONSTANS-LIKE 2-like n=1 Tax=Actinidia eriantha TaxID=165200 RepID=UPI0025862E91|nr:zinc finger protein CONSTANS-LIKE 2-like [Actinidia eriantha]XP_057488332.1 zinc finger protein CONSTANS-LIKE 2-like [Actinidia eriantha]
MKRCELCKSVARMYCESDQASLCWDCDAKVHSANFLVARHSRSLLCHVCQSPTPWSASGAKLGPVVSACESCVDGCERAKENPSLEEESDAGDDDEIHREDDECEDYDDDDDEEEEEEEDEVDEDEDEDGDNQVVPWSSTPPPPAESSSSSEECSSGIDYGDRAVSLKRLRDNAADLCSDDDHCCSSTRRKNGSPSAEAWFDSSNAVKSLRTEMNRSGSGHLGPACSRNADLTSGNNASAAIVEICANPGAVDPETASP